MTVKLAHIAVDESALRIDRTPKPTSEKAQPR
jgi:hypothetical protein